MPPDEAVARLWLALRAAPTDSSDRSNLLTVFQHHRVEIFCPECELAHRRVLGSWPIFFVYGFFKRRRAGMHNNNMQTPSSISIVLTSRSSASSCNGFTRALQHAGHVQDGTDI